MTTSVAVTIGDSGFDAAGLDFENPVTNGDTLTWRED